MAMKDELPAHRSWSRRSFLRTVGAGVPTLRLIGESESARAVQASSPNPLRDDDKFTPLDLAPHFNCSPSDFGPRGQADGTWQSAHDIMMWGDMWPRDPKHQKSSSEPARERFIRTPAGDQQLRGIPFRLGPDGVLEKRWIVLSTRSSPNSVPSVEIPIQQHATFLCMAAFCDWDKNEGGQRDIDVFEKVGQHLADVVFVYEGGIEKSVAVRRRFEVSAPTVGHLCFSARASREEERPRYLNDPLENGAAWGRLQMGVTLQARLGPWISALPNPDAERRLTAIRLRSTSEDPLVICGLSLFHGNVSPLRQDRLNVYRITLPEAAAGDEDRWKVTVNLGVVVRTYAWNQFDPAAWLVSPLVGFGEREEAIQNGRYLYAEVTASPAATLNLHDAKNGQTYRFELGELVAGRELEARPGGVRIEVLDPQKTWLHAKVLDTGTGQPTPVRLAFRSHDGRYFPPYGHRAQINDAVFQDYGADLMVGDASFAYVDGTFQIELPVGDVYVEMTKGFEYQPVRKKLEIRPRQRELNLEIGRLVDLRSKGWVTADTHVHFVPPTTGVLEGEAEGLNLVNVLAAQIGDFFSNVGDIPYGPLTSKNGETIVWVGSENRQHILGHISLLGVHGSPVYPFSASGPEESPLGDPLWSSMGGWADECREKQGLVVGPHFPGPTGEVAADVVLRKLDAIEVFPWDHQFEQLGFLDWYRYLNCGYRLPIVGGTDKMGAFEAVGANRAYAHLGDAEFSFANWAKAVRVGNTFMTTGPLLLLTVEGKAPGGEINFRSGGGKLAVEAHASCYFPIHRLEVVFNGRVVASRERPEGTRALVLKEEVQVPGAGWIAARCSSRHRSLSFGQVPAKVAHTSPVYITVPGEELFSPAAAAYFMTLIDGAQAWVETLAIRPDHERFEKIQQLFNDARAELHRRMHQHGIEHRRLS